MEVQQKSTPSQAGYIITHPWLFTLLPLKAANQPAIQPQLAYIIFLNLDCSGPLTKARAAKASSTAVSHEAANSTRSPEVDGLLQRIADARSAALQALSDVSSSSEVLDASISR